MADQFLIAAKKLKYDGYFDVNELYYVIENVMKRTGYGPNDDEHDVRVYKSHRDINVKVVGGFAPSNYLKYEIQLKLALSGVKDVAVKDLPHKKLQQGSINIGAKLMQKTNVQKMYPDKGYFYLMRILTDKLLYKDYMAETNDTVKEHLEVIMNEISSYLNMTKYKFDQRAGIKPA